MIALAAFAIVKSIDTKDFFHFRGLSKMRTRTTWYWRHALSASRNQEAEANENTRVDLVACPPQLSLMEGRGNQLKLGN
jgi:hypothetical protein